MNKSVTRILALAVLSSLWGVSASRAQSPGGLLGDPPGNVGMVRSTFPAGPPEGHFNLDFFLTPGSNPGLGSAYFWAESFSFAGGQQGYMGLQTNGGVYSHQPEGKKIAIASIWGALGAVAGPRANCLTFSHEGTGWSCRLPYDWQGGRTYRLRLWVGRPETFGGQEVTSWYFFIQDSNTGGEDYLATFYVPRTWRWLTNEVQVWSEYFTSEFQGQALLADCSNLPFSAIDWRVVADNAAAVPASSTTSAGDGRCTNVSVSASSMSAGVAGLSSSSVLEGPIRGIGGRCLATVGNSSANGTAVVLATCDAQAPSQRWRVIGSNLVGVGGKCLTNRGAFFDNGTRVILWDCDPRAEHQKFTTFRGQLKTSAFERCLTTLGQSSAVGTEIVLWDCLAEPNQLWTIGL